MIQRIQSLYLALVFVLVAVMSFLPIVLFQASDVVFHMSLFNFEGTENLAFISELPNPWPIPILAALLGILSLVSIFKYKSRKSQMLINTVNLMINFGLLTSIFLYADFVGQLDAVDDKVVYDVAAYFPIVSVLLLILANRNIRKDEKLIKESDRLR